MDKPKLPHALKQRSGFHREKHNDFFLFSIRLSKDISVTWNDAKGHWRKCLTHLYSARTEEKSLLAALQKQGGVSANQDTHGTGKCDQRCQICWLKPMLLSDLLLGSCFQEITAVHSTGSELTLIFSMQMNEHQTRLGFSDRSTFVEDFRAQFTFVAGFHKHNICVSTEAKNTRKLSDAALEFLKGRHSSRASSSKALWCEAWNLKWKKTKIKVSFTRFLFLMH